VAVDAFDAAGKGTPETLLEASRDDSCGAACVALEIPAVGGEECSDRRLWGDTSKERRWRLECNSTEERNLRSPDRRPES
jgi:hypothetical protein